jgi:predicted transposase/invertase (TIGR01784 family)
LAKNKKINTDNKPKLKILLPKIDVIFKMLFGDARNSDLLLSFLKSVLTLPADEYESIAIVDPQLKRETIDDKLGIVDVKVNTKSGKIIHIEIQVLEQAEMAERLTYYNAKMLTSQLTSGQDYDSLQKTISILITDFEIIKNSAKYHHVFQLRDKETGIVFTDLIEINSLELQKIPKQPDNTAKYDWLQFLKSETEEEFEMIAQNNPVIQKAYVELKRLSQDEETQLLYEAREKARRDENSRMRFAIMKGEQEGKRKGLIEGRIEGALEVAQNMLKDGLDVSKIAIYTGFSVEEIQKLKTDN